MCCEGHDPFFSVPSPTPFSLHTKVTVSVAFIFPLPCIIREQEENVICGKNTTVALAYSHYVCGRLILLLL